MATFTREFLDQIRERLRASDIIGRHVQLKREGREWRGLSPFTNEKTPSFFVNDEKARYFDFSSGKSGDVIGFLVDCQKIPFPEAVAVLAAEAGVAMPEDTPKARQKAAKSKSLADACMAAAGFFCQALARQEGRVASTYLEQQRGVRLDVQRAFQIGYAPDSKTALKDYLVNKGFALATLVEAGLLIQPQDAQGRPNGAPYDRFRHRVMFPITGARGQIIAFGGRSLEKTARAKYLNSPETSIFHKGHVLYNYTQARRGAATLPNQTGQPLIVCEGYMDVIALAQAGFPNAVAPLGTAITQNQLALLWSFCKEPLLCFDGDKAGRAAAYRAIDRALPHLAPGKSLRFVFLPDGMDPDDLVRAHGPGAFEKCILQARPLAEVLFEREKEVVELSTPERRAGFRRQLRQLVKSIEDQDVRAAYGNYFAQRLETFFATQRRPQNAVKTYPASRAPRHMAVAGNRYANHSASAALKSQRVHLGPQAARAEREALLVWTLVNHPSLLRELEEDVMALELVNRDLVRLLQSLVHVHNETPGLDSENAKRHLMNLDDVAPILERVSQSNKLKLIKFAAAGASLEDAKEGWLNILALHLHHGTLKQEIMDAASEATLDDPSEARWRMALQYRFTVMSRGKMDAQNANG